MYGNVLFSQAKLYPNIVYLSKVKRSEAQPSKAQYFFIIIMTHQESIKASRQRRLVEDNKFDRHMKRARVNDIDSRKTTFDRQTEDSIKRREMIVNIQTSCY